MIKIDLSLFMFIQIRNNRALKIAMRQYFMPQKILEYKTKFCQL